jgi:uncharacterized linocin/CFP29 family protein
LATYGKAELTSDGKITTVHTCLSIKEVIVVLADDGDDWDLSLDSKVECAFLERQQDRIGS